MLSRCVRSLPLLFCLPQSISLYDSFNPFLSTLPFSLPLSLSLSHSLFNPSHHFSFTQEQNICEFLFRSFFDLYQPFFLTTFSFFKHIELFFLFFYLQLLFQSLFVIFSLFHYIFLCQLFHLFFKDFKLFWSSCGSLGQNWAPWVNFGFSWGATRSWGGSDFNSDERLGRNAHLYVLEWHLLQVLVWLLVVGQVKLTVSNHCLLATVQYHGLETCELWLILFSDSILFNSCFHFDFLIELSQTSIVNGGILCLEVIWVSHEPQEALFADQVLRAVIEHQELEVDEKLNARLHKI